MYALERELIYVMTAHRAAIIIAGTAALAAISTPAMAQVDDGVVLNILRNCAQIDDPTARLACFDNNIRIAGAEPRNTVPGRTRVEGGAAPMSRSGATGFGREDVRTEDRFLAAPAGELAEIEAEVTNIRSIGPGLYEFALASGAVWRFSDGTPNNYIAPRVGTTVEISRASLGSFLMRYRNQRAVRVERVR